MDRAWWAALGAAGVVAFAGQAAAADYILNFDDTPTHFVLNNRDAVGGRIDFPSVILRAGDTITVNVNFVNTSIFVENPGPTSFTLFNVPYATDIGGTMFVTPFGYHGNANGFTATASAVWEVPGQSAPTTGVFDVHSIRYQYSGNPEPDVWALMVIGFGLAGSGLRRRRATIF